MDPRRALPSRFHYSLSRLIALLVASLRKGDTEAGGVRRILARQPGHGSSETMTLFVLSWIVVSSAVWMLLAPDGRFAWMVIAAVPSLLAPPLFFSITIPLCWALYALFRKIGIAPADSSLGYQHLMQILLVTALAAWLASFTHPLRWIGLVWIFLVLLNLAASFAALFLQKQFATMESRFPPQ
jgi:hypothetical protein